MSSPCKKSTNTFFCSPAWLRNTDACAFEGTAHAMNLLFTPWCRDCFLTAQVGLTALEAAAPHILVAIRNKCMLVSKYGATERRVVCCRSASGARCGHPACLAWVRLAESYAVGQLPIKCTVIPQFCHTWLWDRLPGKALCMTAFDNDGR